MYVCVCVCMGGDVRKKEAARKKVASLVQFNLIFIPKLFSCRFVLRYLFRLFPGVLAVGFGVSDLVVSFALCLFSIFAALIQVFFFPTCWFLQFPEYTLETAV